MNEEQRSNILQKNFARSLLIHRYAEFSQNVDLKMIKPGLFTEHCWTYQEQDKTVFNIIALMFREQHSFKRRAFLFAHPVEQGRLVFHLVSRFSLQVFEVRNAEELTEEWLKSKLAFFR